MLIFITMVFKFRYVGEGLGQERACAAQIGAFGDLKSGPRLNRQAALIGRGIARESPLARHTVLVGQLIVNLPSRQRRVPQAHGIGRGDRVALDPARKREPIKAGVDRQTRRAIDRLAPADGLDQGRHLRDVARHLQVQLSAVRSSGDSEHCFRINDDVVLAAGRGRGSPSLTRRVEIIDQRTAKHRLINRNGIGGRRGRSPS